MQLKAPQVVLEITVAKSAWADPRKGDTFRYTSNVPAVQSGLYVVDQDPEDTGEGWRLQVRPGLSDDVLAWTPAG